MGSFMYKLDADINLVHNGLSDTNFVPRFLIYMKLKRGFLKIIKSESNV
jgi:hypothetical protein